jgi:phosphoglycolate phosphatase
MQLILFDIDGTLVDSGGAGVRALDCAFKEILSIENAFGEISLAGKTDLQIVKEGLAAHGLCSANGLVPRITDAYIHHLAREIQSSDKHLKPGIIDALEALKSRSDRYQLGLLTGNLERGARIKLSGFGLNEYFPSGAFGSDHEDRNKLLPIAIERFEIVSGRHFDFSDCQTMLQRKNCRLEFVDVGVAAAGDFLVYPLGMGDQPRRTAADVAFLARAHFRRPGRLAALGRVGAAGAGEMRAGHARRA